MFYTESQKELKRQTIGSVQQAQLDYVEAEQY